MQEERREKKSKKAEKHGISSENSRFGYESAR